MSHSRASSHPGLRFAPSWESGNPHGEWGETDAVNPHVHLHSLATDGAFTPDGTFHRLLYDAQSDFQTLTKLFERNVLDLLVEARRLSTRMRDGMLTWEHTGFSVDASVRCSQDFTNGNTVCPEHRSLRCFSAPECSMDHARGCRVCQWESLFGTPEDARQPDLR
ncbi:hypothetical protein ACFL6C_03600 [Myxococcota bacterium]